MRFVNMSHQINNLNQRGCVFSLVLNDNSADLFKNSNFVYRKIMCDEKDVIFCALILHELDWLHDEGRYKTSHYHVVIQFAGSYRVETIINWISDLFHANKNQISCEKCNSISSQVRYLIHLDDFDKYQYADSNIVTNRRDLVDKYLREIHKIADISDLLAIMREYRRLEDLISVIGLDNYRKYRCVIQDLRKDMY